jgi:hypothetical protein
MSISFLDCPHKNVQDFTECCLDCGYNIYMTEEEYLKKLRRKVKDSDPVTKEIRELEKQLGIKKK